MFLCFYVFLTVEPLVYVFCLGPKLFFSHFCLYDQSFVCTHFSLDRLNDLVFEFANLFTNLSNQIVSLFKSRALIQALSSFSTTFLEVHVVSL